MEKIEEAEIIATIIYERIDENDRDEKIIGRYVFGSLLGYSVVLKNQDYMDDEDRALEVSGTAEEAALIEMDYNGQHIMLTCCSAMVKFEDKF